MHEPSKNLEIEYLRALAVLMVVAGHIYFMCPQIPDFLVKITTHYVHLSAGVDLFFCISGYVVTKSLHELIGSRETSPLSRRREIARNFWTRRVFRLLPSSWLWLAMCLGLAILYNRHMQFGAVDIVLQLCASVILLMNNYVTWLFTTLPDHRVPANMIVYWSLSLEEQFYLIYPVLLMFCTRTTVIWLLAIGIIGQFFLDRSGANLLWFFRTDALMWGCLIYFFQKSEIYQTFQPQFLKNRMAALACSLLLAVLIPVIPVVLADSSCCTGILALVCAALVWIASYEQGYILPLGDKAGAIMRWVGSRSYSIYLIHNCIFYFSYEFWNNYADAHRRPFNDSYNWRVFIMSGLLLPILVELNYRFVESPLRRYGWRVTKRFENRSASASTVCSS